MSGRVEEEVVALRKIDCTLESDSLPLIFNRHLLEFADTDGETRVDVGQGSKTFSYRLKLPQDITCEQCILQVNMLVISLLSHVPISLFSISLLVGTVALQYWQQLGKRLRHWQGLHRMWSTRNILGVFRH